MQHGIATGHRRLDAERIANVAGKHVEVAGDIRRAAIKPSPAIERVIEHKGFGLVSGTDQSLDNVRADETVGARDKNFLHRR